MDSRRSSSSKGEKLDEANLESSAASTSMADNAGDLEKGPETPIRPPSDDVKKQDDAFLVKWEENDPANPRNWNSWFKAWITLQLGILAFVGSFGSSVIAPAEGFIADDFGVSTEATVLCVALYVLGKGYYQPRNDITANSARVCTWAVVMGPYQRGVRKENEHSTCGLLIRHIQHRDSYK